MCDDSSRKLWFLFLLLFGILMLSSGCTAVQQASTPFWEEEYQKQYGRSVVSSELAPSAPAETLHLPVYADRINGWPLFYRLGETMSILWPMFMKTPAGHAVFPLYEYHRDPRHFFFLLYTIGFYENPARDKSGHYIFPVWFYNREKEEKTYRALLLSWIKTSPHSMEHGLFPLWFYETYQIHGEEGPLRRNLYILLCLAGFSSGPTHLNHGCFPLWFYSGSKAAKTFISLPFWMMDKTDSKTRMLALILYHDFRRGESRRRSLLWPVAHQWHSEKSSGHAVLPIYGWTRYPAGGWMFNSLIFNRLKAEAEAINIGGPLFFQSRRDDKWYRNFFWPIYQGWGSENGKAHLVIPLGAYARNDAKDITYWNLLGLVVNWMKQPDRSWFLSPIVSYWSTNDDQTSAWNLLGLVFHRVRNREETWNFLTPLMGWAVFSETGRAYWALPAFVLNTDKSEKGFYSPIFSVEKGKDEFWANFLIVGSSFYSTRDFKGFWMIANFIRFLSDKEEGRRFDIGITLPVFSHFPVLSIDRYGFNTLLAGYRNKIPQGEKLDQAIIKSRDQLSERQMQWGAREEAMRRRRGLSNEAEEIEALREMPAYLESWTYEESQTAHFLQLIRGKTIERYRIEAEKSLDEIKNTRRTIKSRLVFPLYYQKTETHATDEWKALRNVLGVLWHGREECVEKEGRKELRVRNRLLWKVMDYRRQDEMSVMDMFPFITYDRDMEKDYRRFSFIGPVFRRTRLGSAVEWRILGLRLGDAVSIREMGI